MAIQRGWVGHQLDPVLDSLLLRSALRARHRYCGRPSGAEFTSALSLRPVGGQLRNRAWFVSLVRFPSRHWWQQTPFYTDFIPRDWLIINSGWYYLWVRQLEAAVPRWHTKLSTIQLALSFVSCICASVWPFFGSLNIWHRANFQINILANWLYRRLGFSLVQVLTLGQTILWWRDPSLPTYTITS